MADGIPEIDGTGLGFPVVSSEWFEDDETDPALGDVVEAPEEQDEEPAPQGLEVEAPVEETEESDEDAETAQTPAASQETPEPQDDGTPSEDQQTRQLLAGKFGTVEDLERAYQETTGWATRASQENGQLRQELTRAVQLVQQMAPIVQAKLVEDNPELAEQFAIAQQVNQQVQQRIEPMQQQFLQQQAQQQVYAALTQSVGAFRERHPDVSPNSQADFAWVQTMRELDLVPGNEQAMEIAYEAMRNEGLKKVLKANPHWAATQEGLEMARTEAGRLFPSTRKPARPKRAVAAAHMETGGSGAPVAGAPGERPEADEMDAAIAWWSKNRNNPIMGGRV